VELIKYETADLYGVKADANELLLTRGMLADLDKQIERVMTGELINAGWERINVTMWRRENMPGWYTTRRAWETMNEETKTNE
jgi:hypothetical protein